jgi:hypothetical protein
VYGRYGLLISCLELGRDFDEPLMNDEGLSLLPLSLLAQTLGDVPIRLSLQRFRGSIWNSLAMTFFDWEKARWDVDEERLLQRVCDWGCHGRLPPELRSACRRCRGRHKPALVRTCVPLGLRFLYIKGALPCPITSDDAVPPDVDTVQLVVVLGASEPH